MSDEIFGWIRISESKKDNSLRTIEERGREQTRIMDRSREILFITVASS